MNNKTIYIRYDCNTCFNIITYKDCLFIKNYLTDHINLSDKYLVDDIYDDIVFNMKLNKDNKVVILLIGLKTLIFMLLDKLEKHNYKNLQFALGTVEKHLIGDLKQFRYWIS